jgi:hypothetical protein
MNFSGKNLFMCIVININLMEIFLMTRKTDYMLDGKWRSNY